MVSNHENHDLLDTYPVEVWNGGKVHKISDSIIHLMRGQVYEIDGHKIFAFGGAQSTDKMWRKEGISWWAREMPSDEEYDYGYLNLERANWDVEYVFTHAAPNSIFNWLRAHGYVARGSMHDKLTCYLEMVSEELKDKKTFKGWYCGHYHTDLDLGEYHVLYDDVRRLW